MSDWRAILKGYMKGVLNEEGVAYEGDALGLSAEEMAALKEVFDEIVAEYPPWEPGMGSR